MGRPIVAVVVILSARVAAAFHDGMPCSECHTSKASGREVGRIVPEDDLAVCLRCHGGGTRAPDVFEIDRGALAASRAGAIRAGGALTWAAAVGRQHGGGHALGSTRPPPGFVGNWPAGKRLTCTSCHAAHPNGNYRNLGPAPRAVDTPFRPDGLPSFARAVPGARRDADVLLLRGRPPYEPASTILMTRHGRNPMNEFCASCHGGFHGLSNTEDPVAGAPTYVRHPTTGVPIREPMLARLARSVEPLRLALREDGTPELACVTCHRAHGTANPFGLVYWDPRATHNGEDGAGTRVESLCLTCHGLDDDAGGVARRSPAPW